MNNKFKKKFNLQYKITLQDISYNTIIFSSIIENNKFGLTKKEENIYCPSIEFTINKQNTSQGNQAKIIIYNLSFDTGKRIAKNKISPNTKRLITIEAGYQEYTTTIFKAYISYCYTYRQGTENITEIYCNNSFNINNSYINTAIRDEEDILSKILNEFKDLTIGNTGEDLGQLAKENAMFIQSERGRSYSGKVWDILNNSNENLDIFIDDNVLYLMKKENYLKDYKLVLTSKSGLLESPKDFGGYIQIQTIFEPLAKLNNIVILNSDIKYYNGNYKVIGINHTVNISKLGKESKGITTWNLQTNNNLKTINNYELSQIKEIEL